mmetsp:Transcript_6340/g.8593  ORF Transcript_6340/g.8593 Transcript_6340/m.8593 type:complete len:577 (-) Transcript_6340:3-1733(-)
MPPKRGKKRLITVQVPEDHINKISRGGGGGGSSEGGTSGGGSSSGSNNYNLSASDMQSRRGTNLMQRQQEVAHQRASHFARADTADRVRPARLSRAASTPFPSQRPSRATTTKGAKAQDPEEEEEEAKESWPGPWSTARDLADKREVVAAERQERLEKGTAEEVSKEDAALEVQIDWEPTGCGSVPKAKMVPGLQDLCIQLLVKYLDAVECFGSVSSEVRAKLANTLCRRRLLTPENLKKFVEPGIIDFTIPDCSALDETVLVEVLQECCTQGSLSTLSLGMCGRVFSANAAKVIQNVGQGLKVLVLSGSYRLFDKDINQLLKFCPNLETLELDSNPCLGDLGMEAITSSLPKLKSLSLKFCQQLTETHYKMLTKLTTLESLSLDYSPQLTENVMVDIVETMGPNIHCLSLSDCEQLGDNTVYAISKCCHNLSHLDLGGLYNVTYPAFESLFDAGRSPLSLSYASFNGAYTVNNDLIDLLAQSCSNNLQTLKVDSIVDLSDAVALSLSKHCSKSLQYLDMSFCRGITDKGLGYLVDSCPLLKEITIWGCTQITDTFLKGHSNPSLVIHGREPGKAS